ncbi:hypothetical protein QTH97_07710 [Variovorax sp. J22R24]|uniref:hypothetical protein n=1 Tax=Variovorax gracilis TaxID=3053502 RepID=UPI0025778CC7|nr:hypothetical protein [Variovorax sp. J22R24]MDM0104814.1 hypothetical protein [Variovorax sp. J22R24]
MGKNTKAQESGAERRTTRRSARPPASPLNRQPSMRRPAWAAVFLISLALTGCQAATTKTTQSLPDTFNGIPRPSGRGTITDVVADWPLRFFAHDFGTSCYSIYGCNIRYGNYRRAEPEDELKLSSASIGDKYPNNLSASAGPVRNFPPPAIVTWRSKDGTPLRAEIDIAEIFKDQLILHNLKREEISLNASGIAPGIILEVNDRTISVYMRAHIPTKQLQVPGNRYSDFRYDLIKAFSHTY